MGRESSFNKQMEKEITARAVMTKKIKNHSIENPFDLTGYVEKQKEGNLIDLGLFFQSAEENKVIYNETPVNNLVKSYGKTENWLFNERLF